MTFVFEKKMRVMRKIKKTMRESINDFPSFGGISAGPAVLVLLLSGTRAAARVSPI